MKLLITFFFLMISSVWCTAQSEALPLDERGKFIYYELVEVKGASKDSLKESLSAFLKKPYKDLKLKKVQADTAFLATGKLVINKTLLVMSHPSGEILYNFEAEVRAGKYRFWLTDFNFIPYQRDRYGNFVAGTNKGLPLESNPGKLNAAQWKEYQVQTTKYARQFAQEFKDHMAGKTRQVNPVPEKTIVKKEW